MFGKNYNLSFKNEKLNRIVMNIYVEISILI